MSGDFIRLPGYLNDITKTGNVIFALPHRGICILIPMAGIERLVFDQGVDADSEDILLSPGR